MILAFKKQSIRYCLAVAALLGFMGCKPTSVPQKERLQSPHVLRVAIDYAPKTLSNHDIQVVSQMDILPPMHLGLTQLDSRGNIYSGAAKNWTIGRDGLQYEFFLNTDLRFHNGKPFECESVYRVYQYLFGSPVGEFLRKRVESFSCATKSIFHVVLKKPSSSFLALIGRMQGGIPYVSEDGEPDYMVGLGPYRIKSVSENNLPTYTRVERHPYYSPKSPKNIAFVETLETSKAADLFNEKKLDLVSLRSQPYLGDPKLVMEADFPSRIWILPFGKRKVFSRAETRRCINQNIDKDALSKALNDEGYPNFGAGGLIPPVMPGGFAAEPPKKLACTRPLKLEVLGIQGRLPQKVYDEVAKQLRILGIETTLVLKPKFEMLQIVDSGNFDLALYSLSLPSTPELIMEYFYVEGAVPEQIHKPTPADIAFIGDIDSTLSSATRNSKLYTMEIRFQRQSPFVPLFTEKPTYLLGKCFRYEAEEGFHPSGYDFQSIRQVRGCTQ